ARHHVPPSGHRRDPVVHHPRRGCRGGEQREGAGQRQRPRNNSNPHNFSYLTFRVACIQGWTRQMKCSVAPALAVTFIVTVYPFLGKITAESPSRSTFGGVCEPTPFSR